MMDIEGDVVLYTGETMYAKDGITRVLMKKYLIECNKYKIDGIRKFGYYEGYYI